MSSYVAIEKKRVGLFVGLGLAIWFGAALGLGVSGVFAMLPGLVVSAVVWALVLMVLACVWHIGPVYDWMMNLNLRAFVLPHTARLVGVARILLYWQGKLPREFAIEGGIADLLVAATAVAVAVSALPVRKEWQLRAAMAWNIIGLADILGLMFVAARFYTTDPGPGLHVTVFPLSLLPLFVVPLVIASHILLFDRLRRISAVPA
jgi:hypothetical protein